MQPKYINSEYKVKPLSDADEAAIAELSDGLEKMYQHVIRGETGKSRVVERRLRKMYGWPVHGRDLDKWRNAIMWIRYTRDQAERELEARRQDERETRELRRRRHG